MTAVLQGGIVKLPEFKPHYTVEENDLIVNEVNEGNPFARTLFREAMVRTDLPLSFTASSNNALLPQYQRTEPVWSSVAREVTLKDLRPQGWQEVWPDLSNLPKTENGRTRIANKPPQIGENDEYPAIALNESQVSMRVQKYGLRLPFTIEMVINDQLEILANYPEALAIFMRQLEDILLAEALVQPDGNGPLASIVHIAANADLGTPINPALSIDAINAGLTQLGNVKVNGVPANLTDAVLLVPKTLEQSAKRWTSIATYDTTISGKTYKGVANPSFGLRVVVLPQLTDVNTAGTASNTWYLVANGASTIGRPGLAVGFLRQYRNPQMFISSPNALTPAGGLVGWKEGSFLNDSIEFKARHFTGAKAVLVEGILVSTGAGS